MSEAHPTIGILQTGHAPESLIEAHGDYDRMFRDLLGGRGFLFETYPVVDMTFPDEPRDADGWLITGSKHGAYEDHRWIPPLERFIRDVHDAGMPMVGICFGHQIIAQALGGKVEKFAGGWAVGPQRYRFDDGEEMVLNAWHQDQVVELPDGAEVIAANPFCANAGLAYGDRIWTIQAHPEFSAEFLQGLIDERGRGAVPDDCLNTAQARLGVHLCQSDIADRIATLFSESRN